MRPYACHLVPTYGAISYSAKIGDVTSLESLCTAGVDLRLKGGGNGREYCHFAAEGGQTFAMRLLVERGADVRARDDYGWEPVHYAAANGNVDVLGVLKVLGASMRAKDDEGREPPHFAAEWGHMETLRTLRKLGADMHARDNNGKRPADLATNPHVIEYLKESDHRVRNKKRWLATVSLSELSKLPDRESSCRDGPPLLGPKFKYKGEDTVRGLLQILGEDISGTSQQRRDRLLKMKGSLESTMLSRSQSLQNLSRSGLSSSP